MAKQKNTIVLEEIINTIPYHVFWKDLDLKYIGANEQFAKAAGFKDAKELIGKTDFDGYWTKEEAEYFRLKDREVMNDNKAILNIEEPQSQLDGSVITLLTSKVPLHDSDGKVVGILGVYTDITDRKNLEIEKDKALEELKVIQEAMIYQAKMTSLGEMAGGIAHEINNPLTIIGGQAELAIKLIELSAEPERIKNACEKILKTVDRCTKIVDNLMKFSRDSEDIELAKVDLSAILKAVQSFSEQKEKSKHLKIEWNSIECSVLAKGISVEQALLNLVSNAIDAVEESSNNKVEVSIFEEGSKAGIRVLNSGEMIPKDIQDKMFQPFFTTKPVGQGTDLGLSTSKGLIEQCGGKIIYSYENAKNVFTIIFDKHSESVDTVKKIKSSESKPNIIVVDDEPDIGETILEHIKLHIDCNAQSFTSPNEALKFISENNNVDIVVSDIRMPEMDGLELLEKIRSKSKNTPKVVMFSGFNKYSE
ncbi:MAG: PAS domain-containing protein [Bdellovibrionales bacterium]